MSLLCTSANREVIKNLVREMIIVLVFFDFENLWAVWSAFQNFGFHILGKG